jgi:hypothetical protein
MGEFQPYPACKYHFSGKTIVVKNLEEEAALGGGWGNSPAAFDPYKAPRQLGRQHDSVKWVDHWSVEHLSESDRKKIKAQLLRAHGGFWKSPDTLDASAAAMKGAFDGIALVLFKAGLLSEQFLAVDIPQLVWDSAIAGGWWRLASETRQSMFPEQLGHYWVWRDESRNWNMLFGPEAAEWLARLLERGAEKAVQPVGFEGDRQLADEAIPVSPHANGAARPDRNSGTDAGQDEKKVGLAQSHNRLSCSVTSPVAARRLEDYLAINNMRLNEFVDKVGTSERTLRTFRKTGRVKVSLLDAIACEMGTTRQAIQKP